MTVMEIQLKEEASNAIIPSIFYQHSWQVLEAGVPLLCEHLGIALPPLPGHMHTGPLDNQSGGDMIAICTAVPRD